MLTKNIEKMKIEVAAHIEADAVTQGEYWRDGRGCFIGCLTHSYEASMVTERFGMPEPLVRICEHIFERSSIEDAKLFFAEIPAAIGADGKDLSRVYWAFLRDTLQAMQPQVGEVKRVVDDVIAGMSLLARGEAWKADYAAYAARAAADAARAAAYAAYADYADYAADAARAAAYAARAAAYAAEIKRQRDSIIALLTAA